MHNIVRQDWHDFLTTEGLTRRSGVPSANFIDVMVKELVDNASDVSSGMVSIDFGDGWLSITDIGPGIPPSKIPALFSPKRALTSSKLWRQATRGQLGNGLRVVMGVIYIKGGQIEVASRGRSLRLAVGDDGETKVLSDDICDLTSGTRITVHLPGINRWSEYAEELCRFHGRAYDGPPSPRWMDMEALKSILRAAPSMTVADLAERFAVDAEFLRTDDTPAIQTDIAGLLDNLRARSPEPAPLRPLNVNFLGFVRRKAEGDVLVHGTKLPAIVEVWANAKKTDEPQVEVAKTIVNRTTALFHSGGYWRSRRAYLFCGGSSILLSDTISGAEFTIVVSVTCPTVPIVSDGKAPDLTPFAALIREAAKPALAAARKEAVSPKRKKTTLKNAIDTMAWQALEKASDGGTLPVMLRQVFYAARPAILEEAGVESINYSYFATELARVMDERPEDFDRFDVLYDERGTFLEPHSRTSVGLSTLGVRNYLAQRRRVDLPKLSILFPSTPGDGHRFGAVLFVEKTGFAQIFEAARLSQRYDLAILTSKGQSVVASKRLLDELIDRQPDLKVLALTDFDDAGLSIGRTLTQNTEYRYTFRNEIDVQRLAVTWEQAQHLHEAGLSEDFKPKFKDDYLWDCGAEDDAIRFLLKRKRRVELNAFTARELVNVVEAGLQAAGVTKVIPDGSTLDAAYRRAWSNARLVEETRAIRDDLYAKAETIDVPTDLEALVRAKIKDAPAVPWDVAIDNIEREDR